jgi:hypothetical protein
MRASLSRLNWCERAGVARSNVEGDFQGRSERIRVEVDAAGWKQARGSELCVVVVCSRVETFTFYSRISWICADWASLFFGKSKLGTIIVGILPHFRTFFREPNCHVTDDDWASWSATFHLALLQERERTEKVTLISVRVVGKQRGAGRRDSVV